MKKTIIAAVIAGAMLLAGCSRTPQENSGLSSISSNNGNTSSSKNASTNSSTSNPQSSTSTLQESSGADNTSSQPTREELLEQYKKEFFVSGSTKCDDWYYKETAGGSIEAVLYVGEYSEIEDIDDFIGNFYMSLYNIIIEAPNRGMYMYYVIKENGDCVATTFLAFGITMPIVWEGDYALLNDNENVILFNAIWSGEDLETFKPSSSSQPESETSSVESNSTYISLYDDEIVNISFCGIEKYSGKDCVVFVVENKNDFAIEAWDPSVALDGLDLGEMSGRNDISPNSKGKVYFYKDNKSDIDNKNPLTVSGSLIINAKGSEKINDQRYYHISFSGNIE